MFGRRKLKLTRTENSIFEIFKIIFMKKNPETGFTSCIIPVLKKIDTIRIISLNILIK